MYRSKILKQFKDLRHCFFSRENGFSKGIYSGLNCGSGSKDKKKNILKNLNYVSEYLKVNITNLKTMRQTHSSKIIILNSRTTKTKFNSDGIITNIPNLVLGVLTADCVPILLYDKKNKIIGCLHAGWKGVFRGIIKNGIKKIKSLNKSSIIYAAVGPCIEKNNYEIKSDFKKKFLKKSPKNYKYFKLENKKLYFDLRLYVNDQLKMNGVKKIDNIRIDTFSNKKKFYSFRRSRVNGEKDYGRCISAICLKT